MHYYRRVTRYHQLTLQVNNYIDLWFHSHQQNKKTNKNKKKYSQRWTVESDQFCWRARAKMTVLKSPKQFLWLSTDEPYHFSHYIFNWSPYLHLQNATLNLSNFGVTSPFPGEIIIHILVGILLWNKQTKPKK